MEPFLSPERTIQDMSNAIAFLREHPWGQGQDYLKGDGSYCAWGAIRAVVGGLVIDENSPLGYQDLDMVSLVDPDEVDQARLRRDRAANVGRAFYRVTNFDVVRYNDAPGRTKEQVITTLQTVVDALKKDHSRA